MKAEFKLYNSSQQFIQNKTKQQKYLKGYNRILKIVYNN